MSAPMQSPSRPATALAAPHSAVKVRSVGEYFGDYWRRVRGGEMGALPALGAIITLVIGFSLSTKTFLSFYNFDVLIRQGAQVTIIAMGLIFVLLLGEIDLSAGWTSGLCAALITALMTEHGFALYYALPIGIALGSVIGLTLGTLVAKVGVPSFVVTLAAFLAFQGLLLLIVHGGNFIRVTDPVILALNTKPMPVWLGWVLFGVCLVGYTAVQVVRASRRKRRGLVHDPYWLVWLRVGVLAVLGGAAVWALSVERSFNPQRISLKGVPIVVVRIVDLLVVLPFVLRRTRFGLHLSAVGGNAEAARRAGIPVDRLRISAFVICSTVASIGGIVAASRANSVDGNSGGSDVLLYAVGAAVIGGTSLFGGRGRVADAVLGGTVIAIIDNGMSALGVEAWLKYAVTGSVLLLAASVDALSRKRAATFGGLR